MVRLRSGPGPSSDWTPPDHQLLAGSAHATERLGQCTVGPLRLLRKVVEECPTIMKDCADRPPLMCVVAFTNRPRSSPPSPGVRRVVPAIENPIRRCSQVDGSSAWASSALVPPREIDCATSRTVLKDSHGR